MATSVITKSKATKAKRKLSVKQTAHLKNLRRQYGLGEFAPKAAKGKKRTGEALRKSKVKNPKGKAPVDHQWAWDPGSFFWFHAPIRR